MRLIAPSATPPAKVNKHLLPHEEQVITIRQHYIVLLPWAAAATGGLLAAITVGVMPHSTHSEQLVVWGLTGFLFLEFIFAAARWGVWYLVVTSHRILICSGIPRRRVAMWPLDSIRGMTLEQSFYGRFCGYGTFIFQGRTFIDYIPYPEQLYLEICGLLYMPKDSHHD